MRVVRENLQFLANTVVWDWSRLLVSVNEALLRVPFCISWAFSGCDDVLLCGWNWRLVCVLCVIQRLRTLMERKGPRPISPRHPQTMRSTCLRRWWRASTLTSMTIFPWSAPVVPLQSMACQGNVYHRRRCTVFESCRTLQQNHQPFILTSIVPALRVCYFASCYKRKSLGGAVVGMWS